MLAPAACPGVSATYVFTIPILVPPAGNAGLALSAVLSLSASAYAALLSNLISTSNCSNVAYAGTTATAACGGGAPAGCTLPATASTGGCSGSYLGLCIGLPVGIGLGVALGAAAISYFYCISRGKRQLPPSDL